MTRTRAGKMVCQYEEPAGEVDMMILPRRNATIEARNIRWLGTRVIRDGMTKAARTPVVRRRNRPKKRVPHL